MTAMYAKSQQGHAFGGRSEGARKTRGTDQESGKRRRSSCSYTRGTKRRTKPGITLEESAKEILAYVRGETRLPTRHIVLPDEVDVKRIRTEARMSQTDFARAFCINPRATGMGAGTEKTRRDDPRIARGCRQKSRGGVERAGFLNF
jgi:hypothetical protein